MLNADLLMPLVYGTLGHLNLPSRNASKPKGSRALSHQLIISVECHVSQQAWRQISADWPEIFWSGTEVAQNSKYSQDITLDHVFKEKSYMQKTTYLWHIVFKKNKNKTGVITDVPPAGHILRLFVNSLDHLMLHLNRHTSLSPHKV